MTKNIFEEPFMDAPRFCGQCGTPITDAHARFCGECGAPVGADAPKQPQRSKRINPETPRPTPEPRATPQQDAVQEPPACADDTFRFSAAINVGLQTALAWVIGWLPVGFLFSSFYAQKQALNPAWYEKYPLGWDATLMGMTVIYSAGALFGGFLAGCILYAAFGKKDLSLNVVAALPALGWFLLLGASLWAITLPIKHIGDGDLLIAIPILAVLYGGLLAWPLVRVLGRKHDISVSRKQMRVVVTGWAICGFVSFFCAMVVAAFLE